jgi:hypothetical protein
MPVRRVDVQSEMRAVFSVEELLPCDGDNQEVIEVGSAEQERYQGPEQRLDG